MKKIPPYLDDLFYWLGALLFSAFAFFIYAPASLLVLGVFCLVYSYLAAKAAAK